MKIAEVNQPIGTIDPVEHMVSIDILIYEIAKRLADHCDVTVYTLAGPSQCVSEVYERVRYRRFPRNQNDMLYKALSVAFRFRGPKHPFFASRLFAREYLNMITHDLSRHPTDIIHIHNFVQFVPAVRAANPQAKIIIHMNCEWLTQLDRRTVNSALADADAVVSCSEFITAKTRQAFPWLSARCHTIHNGVDIHRFAPDSNGDLSQVRTGKRFLFVGRLSPEKGLHVLLEAFRQVVRKDATAQLEILGPPWVADKAFIANLADDPKTAKLAPLYDLDYFSYLQSLVRDELCGRVQFSGSVPHAQLAASLRRADVFIHPAVWNEPAGLCVLEAMAAGLPVIATRGGGLPEEVLHGETGLLVERADPNGLADAMLSLLKESEIRSRMGAAGMRRAAEYFSWERVTRDCLDLCQRLLSAPMATPLKPDAADGFAGGRSFRSLRVTAPNSPE